ncbi:MAG TPA: serine/threonine-protein kinase, partial [Pirellulales bacterium]|nr:serine/threonine-protein kinase [Pirellulales bacterium]
MTVDGVLDFDRAGTSADHSGSRLPVGFWFDQFVAACERDRRTTALSFVACHPEIATDEHLVAALGYEEFCWRLQAGERIDEEAFYAQFPDGGRLVKHHVCTHHYLSEHPSLMPGLQALPTRTEGTAPRSRKINWPVPGETVGGFELVEILGRGAFARVYLAEELALGRRRVVVKMAPGGDREANTLGKLQHPNIVPIHSVSFDASRGLTLICMPYLGRVTLHDVVGRLVGCGEVPRLGRELLSLMDEAAGEPAAEAADARIANGSYVDAVMHLWLQMAEALDYTNILGICHCDLKPSNVLIAGGGKPMLLDFNLSHDDKAVAPRLAGTLRYMAPELVRMVAEDANEAQEINPRSDIYSLAVMVYELLSGEHPFGELTHRKANAAAARELYARQQGPPRPLRERNADVDPGLVELLQRCLSFDPDGRPETGYLVAVELRFLMSSPTRFWGWVYLHRQAVAAALMAICAGAAIGGYALANLPPAAERQFLAALNARRQGDLPGALVRLDAAESKGYDAREIAGLRGELHFQLAKQAFSLGDLVGARDHCGEALDAGKTNWQTYFLRARAQFSLGEFNLALADAAKVDNKHPCNELDVLRGDCFCGLAQWNSAIREYCVAMDRGFASA